MHLDEAENALAVFVGHPVGRLDLATGEDVLLEVAEPLVVGQVRLVERKPRSILGARTGRGRAGRSSMVLRKGAQGEST